MSLSNTVLSFVSAEHKEFVDRYGAEKLEEITQSFVEDIPVYALPSGGQYQEETNFMIEYNDEKNGLYWEIEILAEIEAFQYIAFNKMYI